MITSRILFFINSCKKGMSALHFFFIAENYLNGTGVYINTFSECITFYIFNLLICYFHFTGIDVINITETFKNNFENSKIEQPRPQGV